MSNVNSTNLIQRTGNQFSKVTSARQEKGIGYVTNTHGTGTLTKQQSEAKFGASKMLSPTGVATARLNDQQDELRERRVHQQMVRSFRDFVEQLDRATYLLSLWDDFFSGINFMDDLKDALKGLENCCDKNRINNVGRGGRDNYRSGRDKEKPDFDRDRDRRIEEPERKQRQTAEPERRRRDNPVDLDKNPRPQKITVDCCCDENFTGRRKRSLDDDDRRRRDKKRSVSLDKDDHRRSNVSLDKDDHRRSNVSLDKKERSSATPHSSRRGGFFGRFRGSGKGALLGRIIDGVSFATDAGNTALDVVDLSRRYGKMSGASHLASSDVSGQPYGSTWYDKAGLALDAIGTGLDVVDLYRDVKNMRAAAQATRGVQTASQVARGAQTATNIARGANVARSLMPVMPGVGNIGTAVAGMGTGATVATVAIGSAAVAGGILAADHYLFDGKFWKFNANLNDSIASAWNNLDFNKRGNYDTIYKERIAPIINVLGNLPPTKLHHYQICRLAANAITPNLFSPKQLQKIAESNFDLGKHLTETGKLGIAELEKRSPLSNNGKFKTYKELVESDTKYSDDNIQKILASDDKTPEQNQGAKVQLDNATPQAQGLLSSSPDNSTTLQSPTTGNADISALNAELSAATNILSGSITPQAQVATTQQADAMASMSTSLAQQTTKNAEITTNVNTGAQNFTVTTLNQLAGAGTSIGGMGAGLMAVSYVTNKIIGVLQDAYGVLKVKDKNASKLADASINLSNNIVPAIMHNMNEMVEGAKKEEEKRAKVEEEKQESFWERIKNQFTGGGSGVGSAAVASSSATSQDVGGSLDGSDTATATVAQSSGDGSSAPAASSSGSGVSSVTNPIRGAVGKFSAADIKINAKTDWENKALAGRLNNNGVGNAILSAAAEYNINPAFMLAKAASESGLNPNAGGGSGVGAGLFGIMNNTMKDWNTRIPWLKQYAGRDWRKDPVISARASAHMMKQTMDWTNQEYKRIMKKDLSPQQRNDPSLMYLAWFLGPWGAGKYIANMEKNPNMGLHEMINSGVLGSQKYATNTFLKNKTNFALMNGVTASELPSRLLTKLTKYNFNVGGLTVANGVFGNYSGPVSTPSSEPAVPSTAPSATPAQNVASQQIPQDAPMPSSSSGKKVDTPSSVKGISANDLMKYARKQNAGIDVDGVYPVVRQRFAGLAKEYFEQTGKKMVITSGYRSRAHQQRLYDAFKAGRSKYIVAHPDRAPHTRRIAMDLSVVENNIGLLGRLAPKYGIRWLYPKKDPVHFQVGRTADAAQFDGVNEEIPQVKQTMNTPSPEEKQAKAVASNTSSGGSTTTPAPSEKSSSGGSYVQNALASGTKPSANVESTYPTSDPNVPVLSQEQTLTSSSIKPNENVELVWRARDEAGGYDKMHGLTKARLNVLANELAKYGMKARVSDAYRSKANQDLAYRQGRSKLRGGYGYHQSGLAFDLDIVTMEKRFKANPKLVQQFGTFDKFLDEQLKKAKLHRPFAYKRAGSNFIDKPHIELIKDDEYSSNVNEKLLKAERGRWDGGQRYEIGGSIRQQVQVAAQQTQQTQQATQGLLASAEAAHQAIEQTATVAAEQTQQVAQTVASNALSTQVMYVQAGNVQIGGQIPAITYAPSVSSTPFVSPVSSSPNLMQSFAVGGSSEASSSAIPEPGSTKAPVNESIAAPKTSTVVDKGIPNERALKIADAAVRVAQQMGTTGKCAAGVKEAITRGMGHKGSRQSYLGGYNAVDYLKNGVLEKKGFEVLPVSNYKDYVPMPGDVLVIAKAPPGHGKSSLYGHIQIYGKDGHWYSDHRQSRDYKNDARYKNVGFKVFRLPAVKNAVTKEVTQEDSTPLVQSAIPTPQTGSPTSNGRGFIQYDSPIGPEPTSAIATPTPAQESSTQATLAPTQTSTPSASLASVGGGEDMEDLLTKGEGNYNSYNRGVHFKHKGYKQKYNFADMTFDQVHALQGTDFNAVGKYQVIRDTWKHSKKSWENEDWYQGGKAKFNEENQDKMFGWFVRSKAKAANYIRGKSDNLNAAIDAIAQVWASVGSPSKGGRSWYHGKQGNRASISVAKMGKALNIARDNYAKAIKAGYNDKDAIVFAVTGKDWVKGQLKSEQPKDDGKPLVEAATPQATMQGGMASPPSMGGMASPPYTAIPETETPPSIIDNLITMRSQGKENAVTPTTEIPQAQLATPQPQVSASGIGNMTVQANTVVVNGTVSNGGGLGLLGNGFGSGTGIVGGLINSVMNTIAGVGRGIASVVQAPFNLLSGIKNTISGVISNPLAVISQGFSKVREFFSGRKKPEVKPSKSLQQVHQLGKIYNTPKAHQLGKIYGEEDSNTVELKSEATIPTLARIGFGENDSNVHQLGKTYSKEQSVNIGEMKTVEGSSAKMNLNKRATIGAGIEPLPHLSEQSKIKPSEHKLNPDDILTTQNRMMEEMKKMLARNGVKQGQNAGGTTIINQIYAPTITQNAKHINQGNKNGQFTTNQEFAAQFNAQKQAMMGN